MTAPGTYREAINRERAAVLRFCERHPEWERQPHDVTAQALGSMRTPEEHDTDDTLRAEGLYGAGWLGEVS